MIGIIGAMAIEVNEIASRIENKKTEIISGVEYISGQLFGKDVVCAVSGVGKVNAAVCCQTMILKYQPDAIINTGVAGSLDKNLHVLNVVVGDSAVQHDFDTTAIDSEPKGFVSTVNILNFPLDDCLSEKLMKALDKNGAHAVRGTIATGDQFVCDQKVKDEIVRLFGAKACEMEGCAIAHVCLLSKIPCAILRAISDEADESAMLSFEEFAEKAAFQSVQAIFTYLSDN
ncbi:MAG: 5'-methylthioadenosine/adenosylhomocysteine nucleosidase [Clostridia bacterium]|nr:5'-methylthioadenosine/adenosylhomocysteine nucleosidase [Clostridia bacterium]MBQ4156854.1 5'-methylthioadenosine/adenosylhomocysteine nucleosidase [Clostridia bacterium]